MSDINLQVKAETKKLEAAMQRYKEETGKTAERVLLRAGINLSSFYSNALKGLIPPKGSIRAENLARLKAGDKGLRIRQSVKNAILRKFPGRNALGKVVFGKRKTSTVSRKGSRLNVTALMAQMELNVRERARGFTALVPRIRGIGLLGQQRLIQHLGAVKQRLATAGFVANTDGGKLTLTYGGPGTEAGEAVGKPAAQDKLREALIATRKDMIGFLNGEVRGNKRLAGLQ
jgi:hypothetical protein